MKDWFVIGITLGYVLILSFNFGNALKCNLCDTPSEIGFREANAECLKNGVEACGPKDTACMMETYIAKNKDKVEHRVYKYCVEQCPVFINNTALMVRCCKEDGCNKDVEPPKRPPPPIFLGNNSNVLTPSVPAMALIVGLLYVFGVVSNAAILFGKAMSTYSII